MKKTASKINYILLMLILFLPFTFIFSATSGSYQIKVKIVESSGVGIAITASSLELGYVVKDTSVTTRDIGSTAVRNTGKVNVNLKARITDNTFGWSTGTILTDNGVDKFVLAMIFHTWDGLIVSTNAFSCFDNNDVLLETEKSATNAAGNVFAAQFIDNQSVASPEDYDGFGLTPGTTVNSHFFFKAPTSLSNSSQYGAEATITVLITAVQQQ